MLPDEPCYGVFELNFPSPGTGKHHRFQIVQVVREGKVVEYREDLGPADAFGSRPQFRVPGGWIDDEGKLDIVHTVGELRDIADEMRGIPAPHHEVSDLINGYYDKVQERNDRRKGRVRFAVTHKW